LRSGSFGRIRLCQTGRNHRGNNRLVLSAFELFGAVAGLPDDFLKFCFPTAPVFAFTWGAVQRGDFVPGGNVHDKGAVEITASSVNESSSKPFYRV
jgi:hypothetical protein